MLAFLKLIPTMLPITEPPATSHATKLPVTDQEQLDLLTRQIVSFRDARNWSQFHNPKDLALSLSLEVGELIELMQWKNGEELSKHLEDHKQEAGEELADILYYTLLIAHDLGIDIAAAFTQKMAQNDVKYPVEKARNSSKKYTEI